MIGGVWLLPCNNAVTGQSCLRKIWLSPLRFHPTETAERARTTAMYCYMVLVRDAWSLVVPSHTRVEFASSDI